MPELSVTEEQLERFEALRAELEAAFVDGYGHVRRRDAVDYLLDTYTPPAEQRVRTALDRAVRDEEGDIDYPALQSIARNTDGVKGSGMPAEEMYAAVLEAKVGEAESGGGVGLDVGHGGAVARAESAEPDDAPGSDDDGAAGDPEGTDDSEGDADGSDGGEDAADGDEETVDGEEETGTDDGETETGTDDGTDEAASADGDSEAGSGTPSTAGGASSNGGSQLQAMMSLLKTHDDKWRKASSGDAPYEVDLPDGGTETARTKDDVKRILFTNY